MKTSGERFRHIRENVLGNLSRQEVAAITNVSIGTIQNIEGSNAGKKSLRDVCEKLGLNVEWVESGKGSIWLDGTDEDNLNRIQYGRPSASHSGGGGWEAAYAEATKRAEIAQQEVNRLWQTIEFLSGGKIKASANFNLLPVLPAFPQLGTESGARAAA